MMHPYKTARSSRCTDSPNVFMSPWRGAQEAHEVQYREFALARVLADPALLRVLPIVLRQPASQVCGQRGDSDVGLLRVHVPAAQPRRHDGILAHGAELIPRDLHLSLVACDSQ